MRLYYRLVRWRWSDKPHHWHLWPYPRRHGRHA
jgi:hypothetical protein